MDKRRNEGRKEGNDSVRCGLRIVLNSMYLLLSEFDLGYPIW